MGEKCVKKTHEQFMEEILAIRPNINITGIYQGCNIPIQWFCEEGHECYTSPKMLKKGYGCRTCKYISMKQNRMVTQEEIEKRIYDVNPNIRVTGKYLGQKERLECQCLLCDTVFKITPPHKNSQKPIWCPVCSDGISYPNKLIRNILQKLPIENLDYEYSPTWAKPYFYDTYFQFNGDEYIVEMDGGFHYDKYFNNNSKRENPKYVRERDDLKDVLAIEHNIKIIRIDSQKSEIDYIKKNILESELSTLFDFENFDWMDCHVKSMKSDVKEVCDLYNNGKDINEIASLVNHSESTIKSYLKKGNEIGWCEYFYKPNSFIVYSKYTLDELYRFKDIEECVNTMSTLGKGEFKKGVIGSVCRGKKSSYKGYIFRYENNDKYNLPLVTAKFRR